MKPIRCGQEMLALPRSCLVSVRATHPVLAPRLVVHYSYERSGGEAQAT